MRIYNGQVISEEEIDLEYRDMVEEFIDISNISKTAITQYINSIIDLMQVKEKISINKSGNVFYFISLRKIFDNMELKNSIQAANESKDSVEKGCVYISKKIEEYEAIIEMDELVERKDIVNNMFISYAKTYCDILDKQFNLAMQYLIRVKKIERPEEEDKAYIADIETKILKNDTKLKGMNTALADTWVKIPSDIQERIMASETIEEIRETAESLIEAEE